MMHWQNARVIGGESGHEITREVKILVEEIAATQPRAMVEGVPLVARGALGARLSPEAWTLAVRMLRNIPRDCLSYSPNPRQMLVINQAS